MSDQPNSAGSRRTNPPVRTLIEGAERAALGGEWDRAHARFRAAIAADPTPGSLIAFGVALAGREQYREALSLLERAWNRACRMASPEMRALSCYNLAMIHRRVGNIALARQFGQLALAAQMEQPSFQRDAMFPSILHLQAAAQYADEGDQVAALQQLYAARAVAKSAGEVDRASIDSGIAVVMARFGMLGRAVRGLFDSARLHLRSGNRAEAAHDLVNLGHVLQALGRCRDAVWGFRLAARLFAKCGANLRARTACQFEREARRRLALESCQPDHN